MEFIEVVKRFAQLDSIIKKADKEAKPLKESIKTQLKSENLNKFEVDGVTVTLSTQERTSMNEDLLVKKLQDLGLTQALSTKIVPNEAVIQQLIFDGILPAEELQKCVTVKFVDVLKVKGGK